MPITARVANVRVDARENHDGHANIFSRNMLLYIGTTQMFVETRHPNWYDFDGYRWSARWLEIIDRETHQVTFNVDEDIDLQEPVLPGGFIISEEPSITEKKKPTKIEKSTKFGGFIFTDLGKVTLNNDVYRTFKDLRITQISREIYYIYDNFPTDKLSGGFLYNVETGQKTGVELL